MRTFITNLYGMAGSSTAQIAQNMVAKFAEEDLNYKELGIYFYDGTGETDGERWARFDGILASLSRNDVVVLQSPTWNPIEWENELMDHISVYPGVKKIIFIHDVTPLMFKNNRYLMPKFIDLYNKADVVIVPTQGMLDLLRKEGLTVKQAVIQQLWDHAAPIDRGERPPFNKLISFAGNPSKFGFMNDLNTENVKLRAFTDDDPVDKPNVEYTGWLSDSRLLQKLRDDGGFGLVWGNDPYLREYMKVDCSYKLSTYLAAGIPLIVRKENPAAELVQRKHLGLVVDSLDEAVNAIESLDEDSYNQMADAVDSFGELVRNGYFTKRALIEAVFKAYYN